MDFWIAEKMNDDGLGETILIGKFKTEREATEYFKLNYLDIRIKDSIANGNTEEGARNRYSLNLWDIQIGWVLKK